MISLSIRRQFSALKTKPVETITHQPDVQALTKISYKGMTGGQIFHEVMRKQGVKHVFGYPGGAILPVFDAIYESPHFQLVLPRHEQGAGHMAEGYARCTGKPSVVLLTSGPGATNCVTPMQDALSDGIPMVCVSGQVPTSSLGTDAFQEADVIGITRACAKWNVMCKDVADLPRLLNEAFYIAQDGRPGPVLVDLPKDVGANVLRKEACDEISVPGVHIKHREDDKRQQWLQDIEYVAYLINKAKRPVIYAGNGAISSPDSVRLLRELAIKAQIPVTTTIQGMGAFDEMHPLSLHMLGMHGAAYANLAMQNADLIISLGARFDDRVTGALNKFAPEARRAEQEGRGGIVQFDISPKNIGKIVGVTCSVEGDLSKGLEQLIQNHNIEQKDRKEWLNQIQFWKQKYPFRFDNAFTSQEENEMAQTGALKPQKVLSVLNNLIQKDMERNRVTFTTGVGQHQMWAAQFIRWRHPRTLVTSGGLGTMGFGLPAAIGCKIARPDHFVIDVDGDASFSMTGMELMTASEFNVGVKVLILNNEFQGMVRQWQDLFYENRYSGTKMCNPDFVKLAESMNCQGLRIDREQDLESGLKDFLYADTGNNGTGSRPVVLDCRVEATEHVYPMVPAGRGLHEMVLGVNETLF
ncbi:hypothetical protein MP228_000398 [Amoeboaphelidium protococcarum]|nr:hypothetical protein MP228_000398 [Amoeboaphelidium protococcarum]